MRFKSEPVKYIYWRGYMLNNHGFLKREKYFYKKHTCTCP